MACVQLGCAMSAEEEAEDAAATEHVNETSQAFTIGGGPYRLVRQGAGKCLDVASAGTADGTNIQQWSCNKTKAQTFSIEDAGDGYVYLVNDNSKKCLDVAWAGAADGTNIQLWSCNGSGAQRFFIEHMGNSYYRVRNANSGKCVDVSANGYADGTNVQLWSCNGGEAQNWKIEGWDGCRDPDAYWAKVDSCDREYKRCMAPKVECQAAQSYCMYWAYKSSC
jgi:Ricin-type beta-trefoil lectin domain